MAGRNEVFHGFDHRFCIAKGGLDCLLVGHIHEIRVAKLGSQRRETCSGLSKCTKIGKAFQFLQQSDKVVGLGRFYAVKTAQGFERLLRRLLAVINRSGKVVNRRDPSRVWRKQDHSPPSQANRQQSVYARLS